MQLVITLIAATVGGYVAQRLRLPGGLILGAMLGAAVVTLVADASADMPPLLQSAAFVVIGASIGSVLTRSTFLSLGPVVLTGVLAGLLIILAGAAIAYILRFVNLAPPSDLLATSPGALSVMSAMAVEQGRGVAEVAVFHILRVVMVILSLPLLVTLMRN